VYYLCGTQRPYHTLPSRTLQYLVLVVPWHSTQHHVTAALRHTTTPRQHSAALLQHSTAPPQHISQCRNTQPQHHGTQQRNIHATATTTTTTTTTTTAAAAATTQQPAKKALCSHNNNNFFVYFACGSTTHHHALHTFYTWHWWAIKYLRGGGTSVPSALWYGIPGTTSMARDVSCIGTGTGTPMYS
jgi:hypothetical protein